MLKEPNFYARLGLPIDATPEEIRRAYREAARRFHPDANIEPGETEFFIKVQEAYEVISDPIKRSSYNSTLSPDASIPPPVIANALYSRQSIPDLDEPQLIYVLLNFKVEEEIETPSGPPLNLCMVLDCSTSMKGILMDTVKSTAIELYRQLRPQDLYSLVTFSDNAKVLLPAGMPLDRSKVETSIQMLLASGGTEIRKGLETGYNEIRRNLRGDHINHIIIITDGHTYGDEEACFLLANQAQLDGVGISALGIGSQWNDAFLDKLTTRTGGSASFVTWAKDIQDYLKKKFLDLGKSYANRVILDFETAPGVTLNYSFRLEPDVASMEPVSPISLGPIPNASPLSVLLEFIVNPVPKDIQNLLIIQGLLTYDIPTRTIPLYTTRITLERLIANIREGDVPPIPIIQALSKIKLYRMQENVQEDIAAGNLQEASHRLQMLATNLLSIGERDLAKAALQEASQLKENQPLSEEGKKRIKYGTRGLYLPRSIPPSTALTPAQDSSSGEEK